MRFSLRSLLLLMGVVAVVFAVAAADLRLRHRQAALEYEALQALEALGGHSYRTVPCEPLWVNLLPKRIRPQVPRRVSEIEIRAIGPEVTYEAEVLQQLKVLRCLQHVYTWMDVVGLAETQQGKVLTSERIKASLPNVDVSMLIN